MSGLWPQSSYLSYQVARIIGYYMYTMSNLNLSFFLPAYLPSFWSQGLILARQALYCISTPSALFALVIFQIGSRVFALGWLWTVLLPTAFWVAGIAGMYHYAWVISLGRISLTFCQDWSWTMILSVSASSWVTGIIEGSHCSWFLNYFLLKV
jgi:hypothetical protein